MLWLHQKCPRVVKLVMGLHHVNQGGNQGEFQDGEASVWASPCNSGGDQEKFLSGGAST